MRVSAYVVAAHVVALWVAGSAQAADLPPADNISGSWKDAPYEQPALWDGVYVGVVFGGGNGKADITDVFDYRHVDPIAKNSIEDTFTIAGLVLGYNRQSGNYVYGLEAGVGFTNISGEVSIKDLEPGGISDRLGATYNISSDLYGELTGRLGYIIEDDTLLYAKAGGAFLNVDLDSHYEGALPSFVGRDSQFDFSNSDTLFGWTIGLGIEHKFSNAVSIKIEYQHFDFGDLSYSYDGKDVFFGSSGIATLTGDVDADLKVDVVKVGINYKLQ